MALIGELLIRIVSDIGQLQRDLDQTARDMERIGKSVQTAGQNIGRAGRGLTAGLTLPIVGAAGAALKMGGDFEQAMSQIVGLVGIAQEQVDAWEGQLLQLAPTVGKSPQELAEGLFFVTSAGFRGQEAIDVLMASAQASAGGLGDLSVVADAVTSAVNAYGIENLSAAQSTDILTATVREGKLEASELAGVIGQLTPLGAELGVEFDELGAGVAGLTRIGFDASQSAQSLRGIMAALIKPSTQAEEELMAVGTSMEEVRRQVREEGLLATLLDLKERFGDNEEAMGRVFNNVIALQGVLGLVGSSAEANVAITESLADATGATDAAFAAASDTMKFKAAVAANTLKAALIGTFDTLSKAAIPLLEKLTELLQQATQWFQSLTPEQQKTILTVLGLVAALGPLLIIVGAIVSAIGTLIGAAGAVGGALGGVGAVLAFLTGPVGLVIAAVAALALAWTTNFGGIRDKVAAVWGFLQPIFAAIVDWIGKRITAAITFWKTVWETVLFPALQFVWSWIQEHLIPLLQTIGEVVKAVVTLGFRIWAGVIQNVVVPMLQSLFRWIDDKIMPVLRAIGKWVSDKLGPILQWLADHVIAGLVKQFEIWGDLLDGLRDIFGKLADGINNIKLPDWLTPGSATPFELGLRGIGQAADELALRVDRGLARSIGGLQFAGAGASETNFNLAVHTNAPMEPIIQDFETMRAMVGR